MDSTNTNNCRKQNALFAELCFSAAEVPTPLGCSSSACCVTTNGCRAPYAWKGLTLRGPLQNPCSSVLTNSQPNCFPHMCMTLPACLAEHLCCFNASSRKTIFVSFLRDRDNLCIYPIATPPTQAHSRIGEFVVSKVQKKKNRMSDGWREGALPLFGRRLTRQREDRACTALVSGRHK